MKIFLLGNHIVSINDSFIFALCSLPLWLHTACTLMEWNPFRLTKSFSFVLGAWILTWVPSTQPITPGNPPLLWNPRLTTCSSAGDGDTSFTTLGTEDFRIGGRQCHRWVVESCRSQRTATLQEFVVSATVHGFSSSVAAPRFQVLWEIQ